MSWGTLAQGVRTICLSTWGQPATVQPQGNGTPYAITGVIERPAMEEEVLPPAVGAPYDIFDVQLSPEGPADGGAVLKLRRRSGNAASGASVIRFWVDYETLPGKPVVGDQVIF